MIIPHLWFDKEAKEAAKFDASAFPKAKVTSVSRIYDTPSGEVHVRFWESVEVKLPRATHFLVLGERHLRRVLTQHFAYYHGARTHLSLDKNAPDGQPIEAPRVGTIIPIPEVGGCIIATFAERRSQHRVASPHRQERPHFRPSPPFILHGPERLCRTVQRDGLRLLTVLLPTRDCVSSLSREHRTVAKRSG
jgi:hypothetical protein